MPDTQGAEGQSNNTLTLPVACQCGGACRNCRLRRLGESRRIYLFTPDLRSQLVDAYRASSRGELTARLTQLQRRTGWPRHAFRAEAQRLGITHIHGGRAWTAEEDRIIEEQLGAAPIKTIARSLGRSVASVKARAERLSLSRRMQEGYNTQDLARCFGASTQTVMRWMASGRLGKVQSTNNGHRVSEAAVRRFAAQWPGEYELRRVDQTWFKGLIFGGQS